MSSLIELGLNLPARWPPKAEVLCHSLYLGADGYAVCAAVDPANLQFAGRTLTSFVPTMNLTVKGFQNDYRSEGLGAPLAAGLAPAAQPDKGLVLPAILRIPPRPCCRWMIRAGSSPGRR